ncbi:hypothetical protein LU666_30850, partial [Pseudomonas putida]|nr:hypothetical protein [Pseudomonas putida]
MTDSPDEHELLREGQISSAGTLLSRPEVEALLAERFLRIPRSSGHPFHEHLTTDSTLIRPPI